MNGYFIQHVQQIRLTIHDSPFTIDDGNSHEYHPFKFSPLHLIKQIEHGCSRQLVCRLV